MADALDQFAELADKVLWRPIASAPKDANTFLILYCPEDDSRWWASWQGGEWFGVDEYGLRRTGHSQGDDAVTGWFVTAWMPIPEPPSQIREE